jgi:hypothetical protein
MVLKCLVLKTANSRRNIAVRACSSTQPYRRQSIFQPAIFVFHSHKEYGSCLHWRIWTMAVETSAKLCRVYRRMCLHEGSAFSPSIAVPDNFYECSAVRLRVRNSCWGCRGGRGLGNDYFPCQQMVSRYWSLKVRSGTMCGRTEGVGKEGFAVHSWARTGCPHAAKRVRMTSEQSSLNALSWTIHFRSPNITVVTFLCARSEVRFSSRLGFVVLLSPVGQSLE